MHRDSPQSAALAFLADYRAGNFTDAVRYLDFKHVPRGRRVKNGPRLAQQLGELLERDPNFEIAALSPIRRAATTMAFHPIGSGSFPA